MTRDRVLLGVLLVALACWLTRSHWEQIEYPHAARKAELHALVLAGEAPDPYQYKCWPIDQALEQLCVWTGWSLDTLFRLNTFLGLLALVFAHHFWLRAYVGPYDALAGALLLGALAHLLFRNYFHHPYEPWGIAGTCLLLRGIERDASIWKLVLGALCLGMVWEKHALLAPLAGLLWLHRRVALPRATLRGLALLAAALALPLALRFFLGTDRPNVDGDSPWWEQDALKILWFQGPYMLPFLILFLVTWRVQPAWVRILWLALPVAALAYVSQHYILYEVRSFWLLAPIFTATAVAWLRAARQRLAPQP